MEDSTQTLISQDIVDVNGGCEEFRVINFAIFVIVHLLDDVMNLFAAHIL